MKKTGSKKKSLSKAMKSLNVDEGVGKDLNLVDYCTRAIGEWQAIDPMQGFLLTAKGGVSLDNTNTRLYSSDSPQSLVPPGWLLGAKKMGLTAVKLRVGELIEDEAPTTFETSDGQKMTMHGPNSCITDIRRHVTFKKFVEASDAWILNEGADPRIPKESKAELYYWHLRFRYRSSSIVAGIIETIPHLKRKGYKNWILPTGDKVPLDSLEGTSFHVLSNLGLTLVEIEKFAHSGGFGDGETFTPFVTHLPQFSFKRNVHVSGFGEGFGFLNHQCVLTTKLPNGEEYVIDPTARQFNVKGEGGRLVVAGTLKEYKEHFGGENAVVKAADWKYDRIRWLGNGPLKLTERMTLSLLKYLHHRFCNFCGQIEGHHPEKFAKSENNRVIHEDVELESCEKCGKVAYCGTLCKNMDKEGHSLVCKDKKEADQVEVAG